jgi:hypothetical protein
MKRVPRNRSIPDLRLSRKQASDLCRITPSFLSRVEKAGHLQPEPDGTYRLGELFNQWVRYKETRIRSPKTDLQQRVLQLKAEALERQQALARRQIMSTNDVCDWMQRNLGIQSSVMRGIGARCTRDREMMKHINTIIDDALEETNRQVKKLRSQQK